MTQPSGQAALDAAMRTARCPIGMCLWQVQEWWACGHAYPTALAQWNGTVQHRDRAIPIGAPVFYDYGAGHIAVYAGNGLIRSTDAAGNGVVATVPLDWPLRAWGKPYLGWGSRLGLSSLPLTSVVIPPVTPATPATPEEKTMYLAKNAHGPDIWVGDGVTRSRIPNMQTLKDMKYLWQKFAVPVHDLGDVANLDAIGAPVAAAGTA